MYLFFSGDCSTRLGFSRDQRAGGGGAGGRLPAAGVHLPGGKAGSGGGEPGFEPGPAGRRGGARTSFPGCGPGADAGVSGARGRRPAGRSAGAAFSFYVRAGAGNSLPGAAGREQCAASCRPARPRPRSRPRPAAAGKWAGARADCTGTRGRAPGDCRARRGPRARAEGSRAGPGPQPGASVNDTCAQRALAGGGRPITPSRPPGCAPRPGRGSILHTPGTGLRSGRTGVPLSIQLNISSAPGSGRGPGDSVVDKGQQSPGPREANVLVRGENTPNS